MSENEAGNLKTVERTSMTTIAPVGPAHQGRVCRQQWEATSHSSILFRSFWAVRRKSTPNVSLRIIAEQRRHF